MRQTMASTWNCLLIHLLIVSVNVFGKDLQKGVPYMMVQKDTCSWISLEKSDICKLLKMKDHHNDVITDKDLVNLVRNKSTISVVKFTTNLDFYEYGSLNNASIADITDLSTFTWVNDKVGATIMSYPDDYGILSLGTLEFEEITVHLEFNNKEDCHFSEYDVISMLATTIQSLTDRDLVCFRKYTNTAHLSNSVIRIVYNYIYNAMQGSSHYSCHQISEGKRCKSKVNSFYWNKIITAIGFSVMLYSPLLIGVFLRNPHPKPFDNLKLAHRRNRRPEGGLLNDEEMETFEERLALNSPLPIGARFTLLHWGNTCKYILSLRVFIVCFIIIISMLVYMTKVRSTLVFNPYYFYSMCEILLPTILALCQMLALLIITIHPASLSVFSDGSECGLRFDSNRYTCLYRQILNRLELVTSFKLWRDRPFVEITSNKSLVFRRLFFVIDILFASARLLLCLFPVLYFISAPILHIFRFVWFDVIHPDSQGRAIPKKYIPLVLALNVIRAILFTNFALFLSLQVMVMAVYFMEILVLTTIGIVTNYGNNEAAVLMVITLLTFTLYILGSFKEYYNTYALLWRTIVDAGESWQSGHN